MILFRSVEAWIDRSREELGRASDELRLEGPRPRFVLEGTPEDLPALDVLIAGQPGAGKSALGNLLVGYGGETLFREGETPADPPRFQEDLVSLARRFPDRYRGSHTIPGSAMQAAALPSLPAALGVRFTEMWGLDLDAPEKDGSVARMLLDAEPGRAVILLVVRADQQIDDPEARFLERIARSPWKDSVIVVLNLRARDIEAEDAIKLEGFVEEQCTAVGLRPRGVFALSALDGFSPVEGQRDRFGDALTGSLMQLWNRGNARSVSTVLARPARDLAGRITRAWGVADRAGLEEEIAATHTRIREALGEHDRKHKAARFEVSRRAEEASDTMDSEIERLGGDEVPTRPRELLRLFRRQAIHEIEAELGPCEDTSGWPVPDLRVKARPGPGCLPIGAAVLCFLVTIVTAVTAVWIVTAVAGALGAGFVALTIALTLRARSRWRDGTLEEFRSTLEIQQEQARRLAHGMWEGRNSAQALVPDLAQRLDGMQRAAGVLAALEKLERDLDGIFPGLEDEGVITDVPAGDHARRLAAALAPGTAMNAMFHENGFDLEDPDLFARLCEVEYALRPVAHLQTARTVVGWLRPPVARREKKIYPYLDRLRLRWNDLPARSRAVAQRILRRGGEDGRPPVRVDAAGVPGGAGPPARVALPEEVLESILGTVLGEAEKHAFVDPDPAARVTLDWSMDRRAPDGTVAVLDVMLAGCRGFGEQGREALASGRGGLARFLGDTQRGALGWCSEIVVTSADDGRTWSLRLPGRGGWFEPEDSGAGEWVTRIRLVLPAVIAEEGG